MRIIVPDPARLFPPRFRHSRVSNPKSLGGDFLSLAALPLVLEATFYYYIAFVWSEGREEPDVRGPLILTVAVAVLFLWMAFRVKKKR